MRRGGSVRFVRTTHRLCASGRGVAQIEIGWGGGWYDGGSGLHFRIFACSAKVARFHPSALTLIGSVPLCYPSATPRAPAHTHTVIAHTHTNVTAHQNGSHIYVYGCVHTDVHVCHHDHRWVPTPNMRWRMQCDRGVTHSALAFGRRIAVNMQTCTRTTQNPSSCAWVIHAMQGNCEPSA